MVSDATPSEAGPPQCRPCSRAAGEVWSVVEGQSRSARLTRGFHATEANKAPPRQRDTSAKGDGHGGSWQTSTMWTEGVTNRHNVVELERCPIGFEFAMVGGAGGADGLCVERGHTMIEAAHYG